MRGGKRFRAPDGTTPDWLDVFLNNQNELLAFLRRKAGPRDQPLDLLHDLYLRLSHSDAVASAEDTRAYLFRAAANIATDAARAARVRRTESPAIPLEEMDTREPAPDALATALVREDMRRLDEALATQPEETRAMIYLLRIETLSFDEVARLFGVSKSTVEKRVAKALRCCRQRLDGHD